MRSLVLLSYNLMRLLTWPARALWWRARRTRARWVFLPLKGTIEELPRAPRGLQRLLRSMRPSRRSVSELRQLCAQIAEDPATEGLFLRLEHVDAGYATLASLRAELARLRTRGKRVVCYLPLDAGQRELYLASVADRVLAMPHAGFTALGPLASRTYVAPLLERLGIQVVVTAEGRYKSAADGLVRTSMSEPEREQLGAIVHTLHDSWLHDVGARPQLASGGARALFEAGMFGAARARELGIIDDVAYDDQLAERLPFEKGASPVSHERYLNRAGPLPKLFVPLRRRPQVALVRLVGAISERGGSQASPGIDLHGTTAALRALASARQISGVILYIDSPGGSAIVSELLHREIQQLAQKKPVVTWMGNVAASGGYYMAAATHAIVAQPTTLTGSIGVISIRPVAEALFAKLGMSREAVALTPYADLNDFTRTPSAAEEALLRNETARFYERFLEVVAEGRKRSRDQIAVLAEGRVWSGRDAHAEGLVDALGGYEEARTQLDALPDSKTREAAPKPVLVMPTLKHKASAPPLPHAAAALLALPDLEQNETLAALAALWPLLSGRERVLAYASMLPTLR